MRCEFANLIWLQGLIRSIPLDQFASEVHTVYKHHIHTHEHKYHKTYKHGHDNQINMTHTHKHTDTRT